MLKPFEAVFLFMFLMLCIRANTLKDNAKPKPMEMVSPKTVIEQDTIETKKYKFESWSPITDSNKKHVKEL